MASDDLRARIAAVLAAHEPVPGMWDCTCGARTYNFEQHRADLVLAVVQPDLDKAKQRGDIWKSKGFEMEQDRDGRLAERDRYRSAWQSARQRAQAYGEGIVRLCDDRDSYKGWMEEQGERANRAEQELAAVRAMLARRDKRIEEYRESRKRWMEAAYADRRASNQAAEERDAALAALQAVREAQSLGEALAAVAKHDGLTHNLVAEPFTPPPGAAVCLICRQWDQDFAKHTRCPNCGQPWNAQSTTKE